MSKMTEIKDKEEMRKRIANIRSEIDRFEQKLNKTAFSGGECRDLQNDYYRLIASTSDLSDHMDILKKTDDPAVHTLLNDAIKQLHRLQLLGHRIQQQAKQTPSSSSSLAGAAGSGSGLAGTKFAPSPFLEFDVKPASVPPGQQLSAVLAKNEDEQQALEMEQLEAGVTQVNQILTVLATYVHQQGVMVDSIVDNIEVAYEKVDVGKTSLEMAVSHRKSTRRKKCICAILLIVFLAVLALILGLSLKS